jgi:hypothetical protein
MLSVRSAFEKERPVARSLATVPLGKGEGIKRKEMRLQRGVCPEFIEGFATKSYYKPVLPFDKLRANGVFLSRLEAAPTIY